MARPNKPFGKKTSFGKRSDAENSFHKRKKDKPEGRFGEERPRRSASGGFGRPKSASTGKPTRFSKPTGSRSRFSDGDSADKPKRFSKPYEKREGGSRPFRKSDDSPGGDRPKRFSKPFGKSEGDSRPFRKSPPSFGGEKSGRFSKPFVKRDGDERPFRKTPSSFDADKPKRFSKPFPKADGESRPFKKSEGPFQSGDKKSFDRPEGERRSRSSSANFGKPYEKKPYLKREERKEIPFRKNSRFGERAAEAKPFNRAEDVVKKVKPGKAEPVEKAGDGAELIRLNKFMANSGVGSRRQADEYIKMGLVTVNGEVVTEMGHKVKITDEVRYEGRRLKAEKPVYVLLNKPKGFITTTDDPQERNTVMNLVASAGKERIYPVGRLDRNTTGLLLLTNDGDLADKLTHPSYNVKKIYKVELDKPLTKNDFQKITEGIYLEEGRAMVDDLAIVSDDQKEVGIELHIGWNRIVRRIFESLGYEVVKLDRVVYAGLDKKDLTRGQWRFLKPEEIIKLKHFK